MSRFNQWTIEKDGPLLQDSIGPNEDWVSYALQVKSAILTNIVFAFQFADHIFTDFSDL